MKMEKRKVNSGQIKAGERRRGKEMQIDKEINSPHLSLALNLCVITGKAMSFMLNLSEKRT